MTEMTLRDRNLRMTLLNELAAVERVTHFEYLVERYNEDRAKGYDVRLPDGAKVATISLSVPHAKSVVDDLAAFTEWAEVNAPELFTEEHVPAVRRQIIPAQKARTERVLKADLLAALLGRLKPAKRKIVDPDTGLLVDGVKYVPEGAPSSFAVRFATGGRDELLQAHRDGDLAHLLVGSALPTAEVE